MLLLICGLALFIGVHLLTTMTAVRAGLVERLGANGYKGLYSLGVAAGLVLIVYGYGQAPVVPVWFPPAWTRHVAMLLMLPVFPLLVLSQLPGRLKTTIHHPMLLAVMLWAIAHLIAKGTQASMLLGGALLAWAAYDFISVRQRERAGLVRIATGPVRNDVVAVCLGLALYVAMILWGHQALIGVPIISVKLA